MIMSVRDTFHVYNPVAVLLGCGFAGSGIWLAIDYALHGKHNVIAVCFIVYGLSCLLAWE
jgi:hypothetical protein